MNVRSGQVSDTASRYVLLSLCYCRTLITLLIAGGIVCSVYTALSCEFFQFQVEPDHTLPGGSIFSNNITQGYVGLFGLALMDENENDKATSCSDHGFLPNGFNEFFFAAQVCAVAAPALAFLSLFVNLVEIFCHFPCSFWLTWTCLVLATAAQGCTFMVYGQQEFWYVMIHDTMMNDMMVWSSTVCTILV